MRILFTLLFLLSISPIFASTALLSSYTEEETANAIKPPKGLIEYILVSEDSIDQVNECLEEEGISKKHPEKLFTVVKLSLNADNNPDYFVRPALKPFCSVFYGAHLFRYWFVTSNKANGKTSYTIVFKSGGDGVSVLSSMTNKYHNIEIFNHTAADIYLSTFKYNGSEYLLSNCTEQNITGADNDNNVLLGSKKLCEHEDLTTLYQPEKTTIANNSYQEGATFYVWSISGLNLREQPSASAPLIKKLSYGTPVTLVKQDDKPVPYQLGFFSYKDTADKSVGEHPQVMLDSHWIKVKATEQEGYVLDKLLLAIEPIHSNEGFENYLVRVFDLSKHQQQKKKHKADCGEGDIVSYTSVNETFTSNKNKAGSRYFCERFLGVLPKNQQKLRDRYAFGCPSRPGHSFATQQGVAHMLSND